MDTEDTLARRFPPDFIWGVATSSFQIEGAAREDGKGESIWDRFCRQPGAIADASNGDVACEHYQRLEADLDLIASLGVNAYRFSVSWPRVQPLGAGAWNPHGMDFYERLVDGLLARGIQPHLTLNHWDLPQALQDAGGWAARDTVGRFVDYALGMHGRLGDRLASVTTHNEPWVIAVLGHENGTFAPGLHSRRTALQVAHHLLLSHGLAVQAMRAQRPASQLGIVLNLSPMEPASSRSRNRRLEVRATAEDRQLIDRAVAASGTDLTGFVISHLRLAAQQVLADRETFRLGSEALEAWERINQRPARSLQGLRALMDRPSPFQE